MRLLLKRGKQRELIKKFREKNNLTWNQFSKRLKIRFPRLKEYYYENALIPEDIFKEIDDKTYSEYIIEKREENWGRIKGGKISPGKTKKIKIPKESKKLAEFYGIMLGDGNLTKIKGYKLGTYSIRIVGDIHKDKEYLLNFVKPLIENLFEIKVRNSKFRGSNGMFLEAYSRELVKFLEKKGFKPGNKIKNRLEIPKWIKNNRRFLAFCLRGLYDTDGSAYKLTNQNSYQINFCNYNEVLLRDVREALISLNIFPSKITKGKEINITKKSELVKYLKVIGFHNHKHLNKIKMWKIAP